MTAVTAVREIRGRGIVQGVASGPALVSQKSLSFLGDLDIRGGEVVSQSSDIRGIKVAGTVLVIPRSIGSAGSWRFLYQLCVHGTAPAAILSVALVEPSWFRAPSSATSPSSANRTGTCSNSSRRGRWWRWMARRGWCGSWGSPVNGNIRKIHHRGTEAQGRRKIEFS